MSTIETVNEPATPGWPTLAAIKRFRSGSYASPFGLTPTGILVTSSESGPNIPTVFSPRLDVKTSPSAGDTSAPATPVSPETDPTHRSPTTSMMSIASLAV